MLHSQLEFEKFENYPTIRAILVKFYGEKFIDAKIEAVKAGIMSYGFFVSLDEKEEYFLKIEKLKKPILYDFEEREKAAYAFMNFIHHEYKKNPSCVNSAICVPSLEKFNSPVLEKYINGFLIPSDLIGHSISLMTKVFGRSFSMIDDPLLVKTNEKYVGSKLSNYPLNVPLDMINNIIDMQKAGEAFCSLNPQYESGLNDEGTRTKPRNFSIIYGELISVRNTPLEEFKSILQKQVEKTYQELANHILSLTLLYEFPKQIDLSTLQDLFINIVQKIGFKSNEPNFFIHDTVNSGLLCEKLINIGKHIHQLTDAYQLMVWIEDETVDLLFTEIENFKQSYEIACHLKRAKVVSHDANATNFIVDNTKKGKGRITQIDFLTLLSSGPRIYDLCNMLREPIIFINHTVVNLIFAKVILHQYDERERLTKSEIKSLFTLFKAVEIGNKVNGLSSIMSRAAMIGELGSESYDIEINTKVSLKKKKERVDILSQYQNDNNLKPLIMAAREQTCAALNLRTMTVTSPCMILQRSGLFAPPTMHQEKILQSVEYSFKKR